MPRLTLHELRLIARGLRLIADSAEAEVAKIHASARANTARWVLMEGARAAQLADRIERYIRERDNFR